MKREIYKATASGNEYLLSFTARRLMANLRDDEHKLASASVQQSEGYKQSTEAEHEYLSRSREALVSHINQLESDNIDLRDAIHHHQKRRSIENCSIQDLLNELHSRIHPPCNSSPESKSSTSSPAEQSVAQPGGSTTSQKSFHTPKATPDTLDSSSAPGAAESGQSSALSHWMLKTAMEGAAHTSAPKLFPVIAAEYHLVEGASPDRYLTTAYQCLDTTRNCLITYLKNC